MTCGKCLILIYCLFAFAPFIFIQSLLRFHITSTPADGIGISLPFTGVEFLIALAAGIATYFVITQTWKRLET